MDVLQLIKDFGYLILAVVIWPVTKFLASRVIKSYEAEIHQLKQEIQSMKEQDFLPRQDAIKMVQDVRDERKHYADETTRQHQLLRDDMRHMTERMDSLYELLLEKLH